MRVWITGASGFVGGHLAAHLRERGHEPLASDVETDVGDPAAVADALRRLQPDAIAHLAALSFVPETVDAPSAAYRVNFLGAHNVLSAMREHAPAARLLLVSTGQVYGEAPPDAPPFAETAPLRPESPYAWAKAAADLLGGALAADGLAVTRVRPFNHTGAGRPDRFVESSFARQLVEMERGQREPVLRVGNLDAVRDFLHVSDVVDAYATLLEGAAPPGVYNVASGRGVRIGELLERLIGQTALRPRIQVEAARVRPAGANVGDASRLAAAIGFRPTRTLDAILAELLADWRRRLAAG